MSDPRPFPWFSECRATQHVWIRRGLAAKVVWNADRTEGHTDPTQVQDTAKVGAVCAYCGILERSFMRYPRTLAPTVAP